VHHDECNGYHGQSNLSRSQDSTASGPNRILGVTIRAKVACRDLLVLILLGPCEPALWESKEKRGQKSVARKRCFRLGAVATPARWLDDSGPAELV
jgi:hypothetical protein